MLHTLELEGIRTIQQIRTPSLDAFFRFLDFFDRPEFFCILIPVIWFIKGQKSGLKLFYLLLSSGAINYLLKALLASPRPFHLDPQLGLLPITGYGLPSGAAQTVMLLSALLVSKWKSSYKWAVIFPYIIFVSFARIYLGIHFPSDILAGWIVGIALWTCYAHLFSF
jgi:PAP2 superfamily.